MSIPLGEYLPKEPASVRVRGYAIQAKETTEKAATWVSDHDSIILPLIVLTVGVILVYRAVKDAQDQDPEVTGDE